MQLSGSGDSFVALELPPEAAPTLAEYHAAADRVMLDLSIPGFPEPPAKLQRRIARFAYLPCAHMTELPPRARIAGILARRGWQCIVGDAFQMAQNGFGDLPPGVVMFNGAGVAEARAIYKAQLYGHQVLLHARDGLLDGNRWARHLADCRVTTMLGMRAREPLTMRNMQEFRKRVAKVFTHVVGEMPDDEMMAELHTRIDYDFDAAPLASVAEPGAADHIANLFHKLWVGTQIELPWFDVMTAWFARRGDAVPTKWGDVLPDAVVARDAEGCGVYLLSQNVWAVRSKVVEQVAA